MSMPTPRSSLSKKERQRWERWDREGYGFNPPCYLCQQNPATTDDHVPPRGLFATTRGSDAYRLPACGACNGALTQDENYLRNVLASSGLNDEAERAAEVTWRSLQGSSPLYPRSNVRDLYKNMRDRDIFSAGGVLLGRERSFDIDNSRIDPVVIKIVKGLYYQGTKRAFPANYSFRVGLAVPQNARAYDAVTSLVNDLAGAPTLAQGVFHNVLTYVAWSFSEDNSSSLWFLDFYRSIVFTVFVEGPRMKAAREVRDASRVIGAARVEGEKNVIAPDDGGEPQ
jgi:hypothetical protein